MERIVVPASRARRARVRAGQRFRITTPEGCQCVDFWAIRAGDLTEWDAAEFTRVELMRLFPRVGDHIYTNRRNRILLFEADTSPGIHDMLVCACDPQRYVNLGAQGWHASCQENFFTTAGELGWDSPFLPQSISWFTEIPIAADGGIGLRRSPSRPGDTVTLRAEMDTDVIVCSCAQDITEINCHRPSPLWLDLFDEGEEVAEA
jgi:uncharacterized protein YcgI (DUF1989 family)